MSKKARVLLTEPLEVSALEKLRQDCEVVEAHGLSGDELKDQLAHYEGLIVGGGTYLSASTIEAGHRLRVIGRTASNTDRIDVAAANDMGVSVVGTPLGSSVAIAEQVMLILLRLATRGLDGKTLGLVGFGRIAKQVAARARAFNLRIIVNQPRLTPELAQEPDLEVVDLPTLLKQSDFVSLHVPHLKEGEMLLGSAEIALMTPACTLINLAHSDLVDTGEMLKALEEGKLASAAIFNDPGLPDLSARNLHVISRPDAPPIARSQRAMVSRFIKAIKVKRPSETLSLDIVPIEKVMPHEAFDQKRVDRLKASLDSEGMLVNPPLVTPWAGKYVILDGATRFNSLKQLGFPHIAVQLVPPDSDFTLHTWNHAISHTQPAAELFTELEKIDGLSFEPISADDWLNFFEDRAAICYFIDANENAQLVKIDDLERRNELMNAVVATYTKWGNVERTLQTDIGRLMGQFPRMVAVAIFPQFKPEDVFDVARHGELLPAGLTRFLIPGRVLRLNVELSRLKSDDSITMKRTWLNDYLAAKLNRSNIRYYQEPVILIE